MDNGENKEKFQELFETFYQSQKEYDDYVDQFFTEVVNGQVTQEAKKSLTPELLEEIIKMREGMNRAAKDLYDFTYSITFSNRK